jgi:hypothetical protein
MIFLLFYEKECALAHSCAERGRLRHVSASRECIHFPMKMKKYRKIACLTDQKSSAPLAT